MTVDSGSKRVELSLSRQSSIILAAKVFGFVLSFFLPVLVVRLMPQDEVGIYRQVFLIVNTAINILPLGMGMRLIFFHERNAIPLAKYPHSVLGGFFASHWYPDILTFSSNMRKWTALAAYRNSYLALLVVLCLRSSYCKPRGVACIVCYCRNTSFKGCFDIPR